MKKSTNSEKRFYGDDSAALLTYLEFGSIDRVQGRKNIWDFRVHQQAYDFFMLARYMNDLMLCRDVTQTAGRRRALATTKEYAAGVHTNDLPVSSVRLAAVHVLADGSRPSPVAALELGSTLMGYIDSLECLQAIGAAIDGVVPFSSVDLQAQDYRGIDISPLMNKVAHALHPSHALTLTTARDERAVDLFMAKGVSLLYATSHARDLAAWLTSASVSLFDYSFSLGADQRGYLGTGKKVTYASLATVLRACRAHGKELYVRSSTSVLDPATGRLRCQCYCGDPDTVKRILDEEWRLTVALRKGERSGAPDILGLKSRRASLAAFRRDVVPASQFLSQ